MFVREACFGASRKDQDWVKAGVQRTLPEVAQLAKKLHLQGRWPADGRRLAG
jgi:hypothetical protein